MTSQIIFNIWMIAGSIAGAFTYAMTFAHSEGRYPSTDEQEYLESQGFAVGVGMLAFVAPYIIVACFFLTGFAQYGLKWK